MIIAGKKHFCKITTGVLRDHPTKTSIFRPSPFNPTLSEFSKPLSPPSEFRHIFKKASHLAKKSKTNVSC